VPANVASVEPANKWKQRQVLKQRLLTAFTLGPLVIWGVLALPNVFFALIMGLLILMGSWEWGNLAGFTAAIQRGAFTAVNAVAMGAVWYLLHYQSQFALPLFSGTVLLWLLISILVMTYPASAGSWANRWVKALVGLLILVMTWAALIVVHGGETNGPYFVLYLFLLIWFADSAAYFGGRRWGRRKLAPKVSPGKSWEGVYSALAIAVPTAAVGGYVLGMFDLGLGKAAVFFLFSLLLTFISVLGDLTESMFKRQMSVKDSGSLLPGHGGILDRIDSMTIASPVFLMGLWWLFDMKLVLSGSK